MRIISYGLGAIGIELARLLLERGAEVVGAIDTDPVKVGEDVGELLGVGHMGITISDDASNILESVPDAIVVHATSSRLRDIAPQLATVAKTGHNVVSTCEELVYPTVVSQELASELDDAARQAGVAVLGAGINPGFLMDSLLLTLSTVCLDVTAVRVTRVVDTNQRRLPLQRKVGVGEQEATFHKRAAQGRLGHVGLIQSAYLIAHGLGWELTSYDERLDPVVATESVQTGLGIVSEGGIVGQRQVAVGCVDGREVVTLQLEMYAGAEALDEISIAGTPSVRQRLEGGINGDIATVAVVSNVIPVVADAPAGLRTMADVSPLRFTRHAA